jgi:hypothetical protein
VAIQTSEGSGTGDQGLRRKGSRVASHERVLGSGEFVVRLVWKTEAVERKTHRLRGKIALRSGVELGESGAEIARHLRINTSSIIRGLARIDAGKDGKDKAH